ncbi:hypothetical protein [Brucella anthropi]|uniref:hypothetical protein n=1 Tax=Brucella anthropi TaxID=529 RepID=UPI003EE12AC4
MIKNIDASRLNAFWQHYSADNTYNLTNRNCSSAVADALDAALEGVYRDHNWPIMTALRAIIYPELWAAGLMRKRAESMAWTPGSGAGLCARIVGSGRSAKIVLDVSQTSPAKKIRKHEAGHKLGHVSHISGLARAVPVNTEYQNRSNYLFYRIVLRKTASHFCWKCSKYRQAAG